MVRFLKYTSMACVCALLIHMLVWPVSAVQNGGTQNSVTTIIDAEVAEEQGVEDWSRYYQVVPGISNNGMFTIIRHNGETIPVTDSDVRQCWLTSDEKHIVCSLKNGSVRYMDIDGNNVNEINGVGFPVSIGNDALICTDEGSENTTNLTRIRLDNGELFETKYVVSYAFSEKSGALAYLTKDPYDEEYRLYSLGYNEQESKELDIFELSAFVDPCFRMTVSSEGKMVVLSDGRYDTYLYHDGEKMPFLSEEELTEGQVANTYIQMSADEKLAVGYGLNRKEIAIWSETNGWKLIPIGVVVATGNILTNCGYLSRTDAADILDVYFSTESGPVCVTKDGTVKKLFETECIGAYDICNNRIAYIQWESDVRAVNYIIAELEHGDVKNAKVVGRKEDVTDFQVWISSNCKNLFYAAYGAENSELYCVDMESGKQTVVCNAPVWGAKMLPGTDGNTLFYFSDSEKENELTATLCKWSNGKEEKISENVVVNELTSYICSRHEDFSGITYPGEIDGQGFLYLKENSFTYLRELYFCDGSSMKQVLTNVTEIPLGQ